MSRDALNRLVRRTLVLAATGAVLGAAVVTVQVAAAWRAESAPLDTAPVSMSSIGTDMEAEVARTEALSGQVDDVASELSSLKTALQTANGAMSGDAANATKLQGQLAAAKTKLDALQSQLKGAQTRLASLNRAAARQAALNAAARRTTPTTVAAPAAGGGRNDD
jgi:septal ring factor EnvC (AmiA/AmiB activator)